MNRFTNKPRLSLDGLSTSAQNLRVEVQVTWNDVERQSHVLIPLDLLLASHILDALDGAARRALNLKWDQAQDTGLW